MTRREMAADPNHGKRSQWSRKMGSMNGVDWVDIMAENRWPWRRRMPSIITSSLYLVKWPIWRHR